MRQTGARGRELTLAARTNIGKAKPPFYEQVTADNIVCPQSGLSSLCWKRLMLLSTTFLFRTLEQLFTRQARCRLGFERRIDAAISR